MLGELKKILDKFIGSGVYQTYEKVEGSGLLRSVVKKILNPEFFSLIDHILTRNSDSNISFENILKNVGDKKICFTV